MCIMITKKVMHTDLVCIEHLTPGGFSLIQVSLIIVRIYIYIAKSVNGVLITWLGDCI